MSDFQRGLEKTGEKNEQTHNGNKNNFRKLLGNEILCAGKLVPTNTIISRGGGRDDQVVVGRNIWTRSREQYATRPDTYYFLDRYFGQAHTAQVQFVVFQFVLNVEYSHFGSLTVRVARARMWMQRKRLRRMRTCVCVCVRTLRERNKAV